jgi:hypothetical protein
MRMKMFLGRNPEQFRGSPVFKMVEHTEAGRFDKAWLIGRAIVDAARANEGVGLFPDEPAVEPIMRGTTVRPDPRSRFSFSGWTGRGRPKR